MRRFLFYQAPALAFTAFTFYLSAQSSPPGADLGPDYVGHFLEFAVLTWLWWRAFAQWSATSRRAPWLALGFVCIYAVFDEWHQSWVPGRSSELRDWMVDAAAAVVVTGLCQYRALRRWE